MQDKNKHSGIVFLLVSAVLCLNSLPAQRLPAIGKNKTLEIANWNIEWFGKTAAGFGPDDDALQQALVKRILDSSGIDIWALCEISEKKAFDSLVSKLPQYAQVLAPYQPEQKTAVLYNKTAFRLAYSRLLGSRDSFSTMRYPLELALIPAGQTGIDTLFIIVLHLKANTGSDSLKMLAYNSRKTSADWLSIYLSSRHAENACICLGDWNDDVDRSIYKQLPSPFAALGRIPNFSFISRKLSDEGIPSTTAYPDCIDHQLVSAPLLALYMPDSVFAWKLDKSIPDYAGTCSDHYPVYSLYSYPLSAFNPEARAVYSIYPNPFSDAFSISGVRNDALLQIYDLNGKQILNASIKNGDILDASELPSGPLLFVLRSDGIVSRKILYKTHE